MLSLIITLFQKKYVKKEKKNVGLERGISSILLSHLTKHMKFLQTVLNAIYNSHKKS